MIPTEPPQEGPAASDDRTLSWDGQWHPITAPIGQEPVLAAYSPPPSGALPYQPVYASPAPTQPRYRRRRGYGWWLVLVFVLGVGVGAAGAMQGQSWLNSIQAIINPKPVNTFGVLGTPQPIFSPIPTSFPQPTQPSTPVVTPTPNGPAWTTLQSFSGSGTTNTSPITVPQSWRIAWQCNPASAPAGQYEFTITLHTTDEKVVNTTLDTTCKAGNTAGMDQQYQAGTFYLQILSTGDWAIQIQVPSS